VLIPIRNGHPSQCSIFITLVLIVLKVPASSFRGNYFLQTRGTQDNKRSIVGQDKLLYA
jgi:hypothetical protein